jgi:probable phosphoglycerate mutase
MVRKNTQRRIQYHRYMTCVLLLRHGHVAGIVPKRFRGQLDLPLSDEGRLQAQRAAEYVARYYAPQMVYTSPLRRCRDSATALSSSLSLPAPLAEHGFTDIHYGLWQGRLVSEIASEEPKRYALWQQSPQEMAFPDGESLELVAGRASTLLAQLVTKYMGQTIAVYSHDSVIRVLLLRALGAPLAAYHRIEVDPCSLSELRYDSDSGVQVARINERTDLRGS